MMKQFTFKIIFVAMVVLINSNKGVAQESFVAKYDSSCFFTKTYSVYLSTWRMKDSIRMDSIEAEKYGRVSGYIMMRDGFDYYSGDTIDSDYDLFRHPMLFIPEICYKKDVENGFFSIDLEEGVYTFIITYYYAMPLAYKVTVRNGCEYVYDNYLGSRQIH